MANHELITNIIKSNNTIKQSTTTTVAQFLTLHKEFSEKVASAYSRVGTLKDVADVFLPTDKMTILNEFKAFEQVQLAVCGYNASGKTSFLHHFLGKGAFLPARTGTVTARIVKFSYAPSEEARLLIHEGGVESPIMDDPVDLSKYFLPMNQMTVKEKQQRSKELKAVIAEHLARPEGCDPSSEEFVGWASHFIEICIPSPILQLGIIVYDTPGFHFGDSPILVENLQDLIRARHPALLFLYDNAAVSDDSCNCFDALKSSLQNIADLGIFFLNTKADVSTILRDAGIDDLPEQDELNDLLEQERVRRYNLLRNVTQMSSDLPDQLNNCDCFDIFSVERPEHPMEQTMKKNALDRIVTFAAKHDLQNTKQISRIILNTIDTFFDFVLITNRRSKEEWENLRDEACSWADKFFQEYSTYLDTIAIEAERQLPIEFRKHRKDLVKRAKERGQVTRITFASFDQFKENERFCRTRSQTSISQREIHWFITSVVKDEILKPTLNKIVNETSSRIKMNINQQGFLLNKSSKNELIMAAYRDFLNTIGNIHGENLGFLDFAFYIFAAFTIGIPLLIFGDLLGRYLLDEQCEELEILKEIEHELIHVEHNLASCGEKIKANVQNWLSENKNQFKQKVMGYSKIVMQTINHRKEAYMLARTFAGQFARIECRLVANLDLARHDGVKPNINIRKELSRGGFFSIHPASWDAEQSLVAKIILDPITHPDVAYLEAHFHRTVANLNIEHTVPLRYLYEEDNMKLFILLPRYSSSLHAYLCEHMSDVTMDKAIQIVLDITHVVAHMHAYELVHRDIKPQNILLDENLQVFLADFGTCQHGSENSTLVGSPPFAPELTTDRSHDFTYKGSGADVYALGILMYVIAPKPIYYPITQPITQAHIDALVNIPSSYINLMCRCLLIEAESRPKASEMVKELETIADQVGNSKPCLMCLDRARYARCLPCRHKTLCNICLREIQRRATTVEPPRCILCRQPITRIIEDADGNTYME